MTLQLDLFGTVAPSPARRPAKADTALLLAMSADHTTAAAAPPPAPTPDRVALAMAIGRRKKTAAPALPSTGAELVNQSRSCCSRCAAAGHPSDYIWHDDTQELLCHPCNAGKLGYRDTPNAHGVYLYGSETLELRRPDKGWKGCNLADIDLLDLGPHWIWATGYQLFGGDHLGGTSPLMDSPTHRAPTREAALDAAKAELRKRIAGCEGTDARRVLAWLDELGQGGLL